MPALNIKVSTRCSTWSVPTARRIILDTHSQIGRSAVHMGSKSQLSSATVAVEKSHATDHPAWSEYNERWCKIWQQGLQPGQVGSMSGIITCI